MAKFWADGFWAPGFWAPGFWDEGEEPPLAAFGRVERALGPRQAGITLGPRTSGVGQGPES